MLGRGWRDVEAGDDGAVDGRSMVGRWGPDVVGDYHILDLIRSM